MGGGSSPLNTGGGMSGGFGSGQQNSRSIFMRPENPTPYTGPTDPSQQMNSVMGGLVDRLSQQQQPMRSPFSSVNSTTQQDMMRGGSGMPFGQRLGQLGFGGQQPDSSRVAEEYPTVSHFGDMQYRPQQQQPLSFEQWRAQPRMQDQQYRTPAQQAQIDQQAYQQYLSGTDNMQVVQPPPMQNPFQPQQGYNQYQQQMQQMRQFQQPSPFRGGQFQQRFAPYQSGLQSLMGQLRGRPVPQPRMAMDMPQTNQPMETLPASFPQTFGRERRYANPSADYRSVNRVAQVAQAAPAVEPVTSYDYNPSVSFGF